MVKFRPPQFSLLFLLAAMTGVAVCVWVWRGETTEFCVVSGIVAIAGIWLIIMRAIYK